MDWMFPAALALTGTMGVLMSLWGLWYLISGLACVLKQIAEKQGAPAEDAAVE